jgi:hypothetical protein
LFSQWRKQLWEQYAPTLVLAHATYQLQDSAGKSFPFDATAMGFRVAGKQVLLPKSVLEPWKFDASIAASMKQDPSLKVVAYDLAIWPANARLHNDDNKLLAEQAWRLSSKQLRLSPATKDSVESLLLPQDGNKVVKVSVHRRQGTAALGLVEITDPAVVAMKAVKTTTAPMSESFSLALFRFPEGLQGREARPELIVISGILDGRRGPLGRDGRFGELGLSCYFGGGRCRRSHLRKFRGAHFGGDESPQVEFERAGRRGAMI